MLHTSFRQGLWFRLCFGRWLGLVLGIGITITSHVVLAHDSSVHTTQEAPSQDIIVNQLTVGVGSQSQHGPVRSGETLSSIAKQRAPKNMSREQYMNMIFQLNPQAFINNNKNKLKTQSLLTLPNYQDNNNTMGDASIVKQRTQFNEKNIQLKDYTSTLKLKSSSGSAAYFPQIPIRVVAPNTLNQQQKQAKLQAQMQQTQQTVIHEQVSLLQQISQLQQQLSITKANIAELNHTQQQLTVKNQNLLLQLQDIHVKYDHIINNYTFSPKF
ncbi:hypothetical protein CXF93_04445 [Moritella sp. Urea-trap-13]|nr:hypothetical protein CXF93_04445 [Moritella sp. Urea-trap-13]